MFVALLKLMILRRKKKKDYFLARHVRLRLENSLGATKVSSLEREIKLDEVDLHDAHESIGLSS